MVYLNISDSLVLGVNESIKTLPSARYSEFSLYDIMERELGGGEQGHRERQEQMDLFNETSHTESANQLLNNIRLAQSLLAMNYYPVQLQFACLVDTVNGQACTDYSEDAMLARLNDWASSGLTEEMLTEKVADISGNIQDELTRYFPKRFGKGRTLNQMARYERYYLMKAEAAIEPSEELNETVREALSDIMSTRKPMCFQEGKNIITTLEKDYSKLCVALAEAGCPDPYSLTVFQMYTWLESLEERYEAQKAAFQRK